MAAAARWSAACACLGVSRSEEAVLGHNNRLDSVPWSGVGTNTVGGYDHSRGRRHHCDRAVLLGNCPACAIQGRAGCRRRRCSRPACRHRQATNHGRIAQIGGQRCSADARWGNRVCHRGCRAATWSGSANGSHSIGKKRHIANGGRGKVCHATQAVKRGFYEQRNIEIEELPDRLQPGIGRGHHRGGEAQDSVGDVADQVAQTHLARESGCAGLANSGGLRASPAGLVMCDGLVSGFSLAATADAAA